MKFSPKCACCSCVADASHFCACSCLAPFPKQLFTSDGNGSITLGSLGTGTTTFSWSAFKVLSNQELWCFSSFNPCNGPFTDTLRVDYLLTLNCTTGWKFAISFPLADCTHSVPPGGLHYGGWVSCLNVATATVSDTIPFTCDASLLEFNLPTSFGSLAVPGGGGYFPITP